MIALRHKPRLSRQIWFHVEDSVALDRLVTDWLRSTLFLEIKRWVNAGLFLPHRIRPIRITVRAI
jgi:hypothetical protein